MPIQHVVDRDHPHAHDRLHTHDDDERSG